MREDEVREGNISISERVLGNVVFVRVAEVAAQSYEKEECAELLAVGLTLEQTGNVG
jgi:hypothetical protein